MKFSLSENQIEIRNLANKVLQDQVTEERLRELDLCDTAKRFDRNLWQQLASVGLLGVAIDECYGGMGFDFFALNLIVEEVGRSVAAIPIVTTLAGAAGLLQKYGSEEQKQQWLPAVVTGKSVLTLALSEAMSTSNLLSLATQASTEGEGKGYKVSGIKHYVPYAADSDRILLSAQLDGQGSILLLIDPKQTGVKLTPLISTHAEPQFIVEMNEVLVAEDSVLGSNMTPAQVDEAIQYGVNSLLAAYCAVGLGASDAAMRMTAKYTGERKQFDVPIASFQAVAQRAADCYIDVECLRLCSQQATSLLSDGAKDVDAQRVINDAVTMAKIWAGDTCHRVSYSSQQLHGGTGVDKDYPLWRYCKLMRHIEFVMGSSQQHLADLGDRIADYSVAMP